MKYFLLLSLIVIVSCERQNRETSSVMGYAPVYTSAQSRTISYSPAEPTKNAGKIYAYNSYVFQVEQGKGIHVIDNANPQQASKIGFINIAGCTELAIKSNYLYTNNVNDLVVISLASMTSPSVVNRQDAAFPAIDQTFPPFDNISFECPDPSKGLVIGWEQKMIDNPKCRR